MKDLTILKIGGSILTHKHDERSLRSDIINQVANEIADAQRDGLILVHGAGSYGHPQAARYLGVESWLERDAYIVFDINSNVMELDMYFVSHLVDAEAPAVALHPMNFTLLDDGRIHSMMTDQIIEMLKHDFIPVLHGDIVFDRKQGYTILSGDQIVSYLARELGAKRVGVAVNVDGVIGKDGGVIEHITPRNVDEVIFTETSTIDVTGEMRGKVRELIGLAEAGIDSYIFNGMKKGNVKRWLEGEKILSTQISE